MSFHNKKNPFSLLNFTSNAEEIKILAIICNFTNKLSYASIFHLRLRPSPPCLLLNVLVKVGTSIRDLITTSTALLMHAIVRGFTIHIYRLTFCGVNRVTSRKFFFSVDRFHWIKTFFSRLFFLVKAFKYHTN